MFPHVFDQGIAVLRDRFGLLIKEFPTARMSAAELAANPQRRAEDLNAAFADQSVSAIFVSIGGDDSARILQYLDPELIRANPKILIGYSDTTTQLVFCHDLGLVTFYGPSVMAGFAQLLNFPETEAHIRKMLFEPDDKTDYQPFPLWSNGYAKWSEPKNAGRVAKLHPHDGWSWINGSGIWSGKLFGGCLETLEVLKGTSHWPASEYWNDRIVFLETSENKPSIAQIRDWLFDYGVQGVFERAAGLLIGRARDYSSDEKVKFNEMILETVVKQFGARDLPIVTNLDFGHTDPQWILPLGVEAELNCERQTFRLLEPAVR